MATAKILAVLTLSWVAASAYALSEEEWEPRKIPNTLSRDLNGRFTPKFSLEDRIKQAVYEGLRPVRNMQFRVSVQSGSGGVTIAQFRDKTFIVRDGTLYECDGTISEKDGSCSGSTTRFKLQNKSDYCYIPVSAQLNNWYCIAPNDNSISSGIINNKAYCESSSGDALLISTSEYRTLCKSGDVKYTYFTYKEVGDHGPEVQCRGENPTICTLQSHAANVIG